MNNEFYPNLPEESLIADMAHSNRNEFYSPKTPLLNLQKKPQSHQLADDGLRKSPPETIIAPHHYRRLICRPGQNFIWRNKTVKAVDRPLIIKVPICCPDTHIYWVSDQASISCRTESRPKWPAKDLNLFLVPGPS